VFGPQFIQHREGIRPGKRPGFDLGKPAIESLDEFQAFLVFAIDSLGETLEGFGLLQWRQFLELFLDFFNGPLTYKHRNTGTKARASVEPAEGPIKSVGHASREICPGGTSVM
jgi:hypothetical protein